MAEDVRADELGDHCQPLWHDASDRGPKRDGDESQVSRLLESIVGWEQSPE